MTDTVYFPYKEALIVVDVQNDFLPGGALAVSEGDRIIPVVNRLIQRFEHVVLTQDWHPSDHISFASNHVGSALFSTIETEHGLQTLWPDHCVAGTLGAEFSQDLATHSAQVIIRKGTRSSIDSYSGFVEHDGVTRTGLAGWLREKEIVHLIVCGLATDFCVAATAIDGAASGFDVTVVTDASAAIDTNGSLAAAVNQMEKAGVRLLDSSAFLG